MTPVTRRTVITTALLAALAGFAACTAPALAVTQGELKQRFKDRYPAILKAKQAGHIGETMTGFVAAVDPSTAPAEVRTLIESENADRQALYQLIAAEEETAVDVVAKHNALRNYEKARPGEYLQKADGTWAKKKG